MKELLIVHACDWNAVYINRVLACEDARIDARDLVDLQGDDDAVKLAYVDAEGTPLDDYVDDHGGFPETYPGTEGEL